MVDIVMKEKETGKLSYFLGFTGDKGSAVIADVMDGNLKMVPLVTFISKYVADEDGYCECCDECEESGLDDDAPRECCDECEESGLDDDAPRVFDDGGRGIVVEVPVADGVSINMSMNDSAAEQFVTLVSNKLNSRWKK